MPQSLQCPRCNGSVTVDESAAGQRVQCPHCDQAFVAPGVATSKNDDDDWLTLKDEPAQANPAQPTGAPTNPPPAAPNLSAEDQAVLSEFTQDLDEFTAEIDAPPPAAKPLDPPPPQSSGMAAMMGGPAPARPATPAKPARTSSEYRVRCHLCGTFTYVKPAQTGATIKCSDCHSPIIVPPPPKEKTKPDLDPEDAQTFALEARAAERKDPFQRSADDLLEEAAREDDDNDDAIYTDTPSVKEWASRVFGIFLDPGVLAHWLILSTFAGLPTYFALGFESPILMLGLFPAGFFLGTIVVSCGFAILQSVANEEDTVSEWPVFDVYGWISQLFGVFSAAFVAAVPALVITQFIFKGSLIGVGLTMFSIYSLFPIVLLSMLDMQSPFIPFSAEVARSFTKCEEAWGGFYFSSGMLFVGLFLMFMFITALANIQISAIITIFLSIAATFIYFAMIGRLAYSIGHVTNAPPMENDINRSQPARTRDGSV